jgi:hypothetical protein
MGSLLLIKIEMKNFMKIKKYIPAIVLGLIFTSCSLDIEETDSLITEEGIFDGVDNPTAQVTTIYNNLRGVIENQEKLYAMTEVSTDELVVPTRGTDWGDNGVWRNLHVHTWGPTHRDVVNVWNDMNGGVLKCTEVLDPLTTTATALDIAEAKFARAYQMWIVFDFWRQVPFKNPTDGPDVLPTVLTTQEAYDLIIQDLTEAIVDLPASNPTATDKSRPVKATARFFLAKLKLNAKVYFGTYGASDLQDVIDLVDDIEAEGYGLVNNYFDIFKGPTFTNTDVIWSVGASTGNRMWSGLHYNQGHPGNTGGGWNGFSTLAEFYDKFEDGGTGDNNAIGGGQEERRGYTHTLASTDAVNYGFGFGFQIGQMYGIGDVDYDGPETTIGPRPLRNRTGAPLIFTKDLPGLIGNTEVTGMRLLKYSPVNGSFTSGVVMARFADAHLMRAEAMLRSGDATGALAEVNELRALRANTPALAGPLTEAELLDERGRELYTEMWRRNDMIRFGVFNAAREFKEATDDHVNLFPIPGNAILSNPNLVQNPGY